MLVIGFGQATLTKAGDGSLTLAAANTYSGDTRVSGGTLRLADANAMQNSTLDYNNYGGVLSFGTLAGVNLGGLKGVQSLSLINANADPVALSVGNNNESTTYSGQLSGGGSLGKVGTGTLTLTGTNTYTGGTAVNAGMLQAKGPAALPGYNAAGSVAVNNSGTLAINVGGSGEWAARTSTPCWAMPFFRRARHWAWTPPTRAAASLTTATSAARGVDQTRHRHADPRRRDQLRRPHDDRRRHAGH